MKPDAFKTPSRRVMVDTSVLIVPLTGNPAGREWMSWAGSSGTPYGLTLILSGCLGSMIKPPTDPHSVSGKIVDGDGDPIDGVTLLLNGDSNQTTTSKANGWQFVNIKGENTITPSLADHSFHPAQIHVTTESS